jgi:flap endonuclease-1
MGVKNLNSLIEKYSQHGKKREHLSVFQGMTFAIDANVYLYKYLYGKSNHIDGMFFMVNKFKKFEIKPIFIFDGKPPSEKMNTILYRRDTKYKLFERILELRSQLSTLDISSEKYTELQEEITQIEKRIVFVNIDIIKSTKQLLDYMGIPYIEANAEAEHICSKLSQLGIVDAVVSEDMDTIACGANIVIRNFSNRDDSVDVYYLKHILDDMNLNYNSFIDMCILLGNDYIQRIRGYNPDDIYNDLIKLENIENVLENKSIKLSSNINRLRDIYMMKDISIDTEQVYYQLHKQYDIQTLLKFMKENSNIDMVTVKHRISKMYPFNNVFRFIIGSQ